MAYDPHNHHRRSIRLNGYDYSQEGAYFVTVCVQHGLLLLEQDGVEEMIAHWWSELPKKFSSAEPDSFVVMPNHLHFIVVFG